MTPDEMRRAAVLLDFMRQYSTALASERLDLATKLRALAAADEWQPIETAPRDGTYILGYRSNGEISRCRVIPRDDCEMWEFGNTSGAYEFYPRIRPTHWRPLPPPPQGREG